MFSNIPVWILYVLGGVFSASIASFYITLAERILFYFYTPERKKHSFFGKWKQIFFKPSHCLDCSKNLNSLELFPVFGYLIFKGKCSNCKTKISYLYPLSELLFAVLFCILFYLSGNFLYSAITILLFGHLTIAMYTDFKKFSLDYENLPFITGLGVLANFLLLEKFPDKYDGYVFLGFLGFYFLIWIINRKGVGLGDVFFAPVFAFISGNPWWILYMNSSYLIALVITFVTRKPGEKFSQIPIPMGFYLSIGVVLAYLAKSSPIEL